MNDLPVIIWTCIILLVGAVISAFLCIKIQGEKRYSASSRQFGTLWGILFFSLVSLIFAYFLNYHAQRKILRPDDYDVTVVPAVGMVASPGSDFRRSEDGAYFVKIATLGSSHYVSYLAQALIPVMFLSITGIIVAVYDKRRENAKAGVK